MSESDSTGTVSCALVIGVNGQDGFLLAGKLLARGYRVVGAGRSAGPREPIVDSRFTYHRLDLRDENSLQALLLQVNPDVIFHVAAVHGPSGFFYESVFRDALLANVASLHNILEHARLHNPALRIVYASSSKVFGRQMPQHVTEKSPMKTTCLYSLTKNSARELLHFYRDTHGIRSSVLFLFNHESKFRQKSYFIPRVVDGLNAALRKAQHALVVATLEFRCDWGAADEYMDIAVDISEKAIGRDFVIATGKTLVGRQFVQTLFDAHGLDYRSFIQESLSGVPLPPDFRADVRGLELAIGRRPVRSIYDVCDEMLKG